MAKLRRRLKKRLLHLLGYRAPVALKISELNQDVLPSVKPVFVLSTGRCGTSWLTELLRLSQHVHVNHTDYPELVRQGRLAYEQHASHPEMFQEIIRATRDGYLAQAHWMGQTYVETNPRICFLAYAVALVYPSSRYIHLYRHPGDVVRSGLRRGWYSGVTDDEGRIILHNNHESWQRMTDIEKISWLWNETNQFIETFLTHQPDASKLRVKAESMFTDVATSKRILEYIGVTDIPDAVIEKRLSQRVSAQRSGKRVGPYADWTEAEKEQLRRHATLASKYGYPL
jgi:hypothetical protein